MKDLINSVLNDADARSTTAIESTAVQQAVASPWTN